MTHISYFLHLKATHTALLHGTIISKQQGYYRTWESLVTNDLMILRDKEVNHQVLCINISALTTEQIKLRNHWPLLSLRIIKKNLI